MEWNTVNFLMSFSTRVGAEFYGYSRMFHKNFVWKNDGNAGSKIRVHTTNAWSRNDAVYETSI